MASFLSRAYDRTTLSPYFVRHITSWLLPPWALAAIRALISLYIFTTIFVTIGLERASGNAHAAVISFAFFTNLTWWGLGFYTAVSAAHGLVYSLSGGGGGGEKAGLAKPSSSSSRSSPLVFDAESGGERHEEVVVVGGGGGAEGVPGALRWAHGWFYATVTVFPFLVTGVFWGLLAKGALFDPFSTWNNISEHAINSGFASFEIVVPRTEATPWIHALPLVIILALYLGLTYLSHSINGTYVYPFLDQQKNGAGITAAYIVGILVGAVILFAIVHFVIKFRRWLTETKLGLTGKMSSQAVRRTNPERFEQVQVVEEKVMP